MVNHQSANLQLIISSNQENEKIHIESTKIIDELNPEIYKFLNLSFPHNADYDDENPCIKILSKYISNLNCITSLKLNDCRLSEIPNSFGVLRLKKLDLSNNILRYVPRCLYTGLREVEHLNLSDNHIQDFSYEPLCKKTLINLNLYNSGLKYIPEWVFKSEHLEELSSAFSCINDKFVNINQGNLKRIIFNNSNLSQKNITVIKNWAALKLLDLSNKVSKIVNNLNSVNLLLEKPRWQLSIVSLIMNNVGLCELPPSIGLLYNLKELQLEKNNLDLLPNEITSLHNLETLNISHNNVYNIPKNFENLINLKVLKASSNKITSGYLSNNHTLKYIDLYSNQVEFVCFSSNNELESIDLEDNYIDNDKICAICTDYYKKRDNLRNCIPEEIRKIGPITDILQDGSQSSSHSDCSDIEYSEEDTGSENIVIEAKEEESWDCYDNQEWKDVSNSDNEFEGDVAQKRQMMKESDELISEIESIFIDAN